MVVAITLDGRGQFLYRVLHSKRLGELFVQFADITTNGRGLVGEILQSVQLINALLSHLAGNSCSESGTAPSGLSTSLLMLLMTTVDWRLVASRATAVAPSCPGRAIRRIRQSTRILHDFGHSLGHGGVHENLICHALSVPATNRSRFFSSALVTVGRMKCSSSKRTSLRSWANREREAARCCLGPVSEWSCRMASASSGLRYW
jgi:hypothetical protein